jgi:Pvc16 N-terminal domain
MSNSLTIATVTAALQHTLLETLSAVEVGAAVTTVRPDNPDKSHPKMGANIYLYQVTPNTAWRNHDLPSRSSNGNLVERPRAALDLHYLISCYGDDAQLEPQRVLGCVVRSLHERPLLLRNKILEAMSTFNFLRDSNLAQEPESVRFTPTLLTLEELSKLWSVLFQTSYVLSVAYQASVVFIDSDETPRVILPVREAKVYVRPFRQPVIERIESTSGAQSPLAFDSTLLVKGENLRGNDVTHLLVSGKKQTPRAQDIAASQISLPMPAGLRPGVHTVQIVHQVKMGQPATPHLGCESNVATFVLHPIIGGVAVSGSKSKTKDGIKLFSATVTIKFKPKVGKTQRVSLLLNELIDDPDAESAHNYSFPAPEDNDITSANENETASIDFAVSGIAAGDYLVRVLVDGAQSQLRSDAKGKYDSPQISFA